MKPVIEIYELNNTLDELTEALAKFKRLTKAARRSSDVDQKRTYDDILSSRVEPLVWSTFGWPDIADVPAIIKRGGNPYLRFHLDHNGASSGFSLTFEERPPRAFADFAKNALAMGSHLAASDDWIRWTSLRHKARDFATLFFSWAVPNAKAINAIAELESIVEVGSGRGYWAWLLRQKGVDVTCFDPHPYAWQWTPTVRRLPARWRSANALMFCWPSYGDLWSGRLLSQYKGENVIYVGEGDGGCTGNARFHRLLRERYEEVEYVNIPQWFYLHDVLTIWKRK